MPNWNYRHKWYDSNNENTLHHGYGQQKRGVGSRTTRPNKTTEQTLDLDRIVESVLQHLKEREKTPNVGNLPDKHVVNSTNTEFQKLWKTLFKIIQIDHHIKNWVELPKSIKKNLTYLGQGIKPPDPSNALSADIAEILTEAGEKIRERTRLHLLIRIDTHRDALRNMHGTDKRQAIDMAYKHLSNRLGHKIQNLRQKLELEAGHIGENLPTTPIAPEKTTTTTTTTNEDIQPTAAKKQRLEQTSRLSLAKKTKTTNQISSETAPHKTRSLPTTPTTKRTEFKIIHDTIPYAITLRDKATVVIVADDSLLELDENHITLTWQLDVIRGAEIGDLGRIIKQIPFNPSQHLAIVMAGGLNHKNGQYNTATDEQMTQISNSIKDGQKIFCIGCSTDLKMKELEKKNITSLNKNLKTVFKGNYMEPPTSEDINLTEDKIKFDKSSCFYIWEELQQRLLHEYFIRGEY